MNSQYEPREWCDSFSSHFHSSAQKPCCACHGRPCSLVRTTFPPRRSCPSSRVKRKQIKRKTPKTREPLGCSCQSAGPRMRQKDRRSWAFLDCATIEPPNHTQSDGSVSGLLDSTIEVKLRDALLTQSDVSWIHDHGRRISVRKTHLPKCQLTPQ